MTRSKSLAYSWTLLVALASTAPAQEVGNVIFFHPDGMGVNTWGAVRLRYVGPDGRLNWDELPHLAVYTGHMKDALTATSHGAATVHAYGVKVEAESFGLDGDQPIQARSGQMLSIMEEAQAAGRAVGLVNSGTITEPGTGAFLASVRRRTNHNEIARLILEAQPDVILGGGERYFLPEGLRGVHGVGARSDGLNLILRARELGYTVVFTRDQLRGLPPNTERLLGLFAPHHTFNAEPEEALRRSERPLYLPGAPSIAEMVEAALAVLSRKANGFLLVAEEEGTDDFANANNAAGTLEAGWRADQAIGVIRGFIAQAPHTLLLVTSDSDAGGLQVIGRPPGSSTALGSRVRERDPNGAPLDGAEGTASPPFLSSPDRRGFRWPFAIAWATRDDVSGGILVRAAGLNAELVTGTLDSSDIYRVMYQTLFGRRLE